MISRIFAAFWLIGLRCALGGIPSNYVGPAWVDKPIAVVVDTSGLSATQADSGPGLYTAILRAASEWNAAIGLKILHVQPIDSPAPSSRDALGNGISEIYFSTTISPTQSFGTQFGYTSINRAASGLLLEADMIFNPGHEWLVYDGPLQYTPAGDRIAEMHRVSLHEFGHLLGLTHPTDDSYLTIMRSRMNDLYSLAPRDIEDAKLIKQAILSFNRPLLRNLSENGRFISSRGTANSFFTKHLWLNISGDSGIEWKRIRVREHWRVRIPEPKGSRYASLVYRMQGQLHRQVSARKRLF